MQTVYSALRQEIIATDQLMHWFTLIIFLALLTGIFVCETRRTALSVLLPLLSVGWAASILRFDFFIQRIGTYLSPIENKLLEGTNILPWERWKASLPATKMLVPIADFLLFAAIFVVTAFILMGPTRSYFKERQWRGAQLYTASILVIMVVLLASIAFVPSMAGR